MSEILILFSVLAVVFALIINSLRVKAYRNSVIFQMYAIRDELIALVAEEKLSQNDRVFKYYYRRVNLLLSAAPNVGVDDVLKAMFKAKSENQEEEFERSMSVAKDEADEMLALAKDAAPEVSEAISSYYEVSRKLILAHSSISRIISIFIIRVISLKFSRYRKQLKTFVPNDVKNQVKVLDFAGLEADKFAELKAA